MGKQSAPDEYTAGIMKAALHTLQSDGDPERGVIAYALHLAEKEIERLSALSASRAEPQPEDMAMMIRLLVRGLRKVDPDSALAQRAMNYLGWHGLQGSPLRSARDLVQKEQKE